MRKRRVIVVGAGAAGLAAAIALAEAGHGVTLVHMGHHLGGRAASWRSEDGFPLEHGFHAVIGFYSALRGLMARAGIREESALAPCGGVSYVYEPARETVARFRSSANPLVTLFSALSYDGLDADQKLDVARFSLEQAYTIFHGDVSGDDDVCFTTWAVERGLDPSVTYTNNFRFTRDALFNWPHEVSAYVQIQAIREVFRSAESAEVYLFRGPPSEVLWEPLGRYLERLGGAIVPRTLLLGLCHDGRRVTGLRLASPDPAPHEHGRRSFEGAVPALAGTERVESGFDAAILAIPLDCFRALNPGDRALWSWAPFAALANLRTVATLSWQLWLDEAPGPALEAPVNGLAEPLGMLWDAKRVKPEYARDARFAAALELVGQETGFEPWSDAEIQEHALRELARVPGFRRIEPRGIVRSAFRRNRAHHSRYLLTEPGVLQFRPRTRTPLANLFLAGDWVRGGLDVPCMEAAARSGIAAAEAVMEDAK